MSSQLQTKYLGLRNGRFRAVKAKSDRNRNTKILVRLRPNRASSLLGYRLVGERVHGRVFVGFVGWNLYRPNPEIFTKNKKKYCR